MAWFTRVPLVARLYNWTYVKKHKEGENNIFSDHYQNNYWGDVDSVSGGGSNLKQTQVVRRELPLLLKTVSAKSFLDIPCGDFYWMQHVNLDEVIYIGGDIVPELIDKNNTLFDSEKKSFEVMDLLKTSLPKVDVVFVRDCLVHLSYEDISTALKNIKKSRSTYLLTTTFTKRKKNKDIDTGYWRPLQLQASPFNFPKPIKIINERCTEGFGRYSDKSLALWKISDIEI